MAGGFWAGFGEELTGRIKEREQFVRDETAKRQDYLLRVGVPARMRMNQQMQADMNTIRQAQELGFDERTAVALWQSGQLESAMETANKEGTPSDYINTVVTWATDNVGEGLTAQEAVSRAYGAATNVDTTTPEGRRRGFFEAMFALNPQQAVEENLASFNIAGMTQDDLLAAAGFQGPQMSPVAGATYNPTAGYAMSDTDQGRFRRIFRGNIQPYYEDGFNISAADMYGNTLITTNSDRGREAAAVEAAAMDAYNRLRRFGLDGKSRGLSHEEAMRYVDLTFTQGVTDGTSNSAATIDMYNQLGREGAAETLETQTGSALGEAVPTGGEPVVTPEVTVENLDPLTESILERNKEAIDEAEQAVEQAGTEAERAAAEQDLTLRQDEEEFLKNLPPEQKEIAQKIMESDNVEKTLDEILFAHGEKLREQGVPEYEIQRRVLEYKQELEDIAAIVNADTPAPAATTFTFRLVRPNERQTTQTSAGAGFNTDVLIND